MNRDEIVNYYDDDSLIFLDPPETFDSAIIGVVTGMGLQNHNVVCYSTDQIIENLMEDGMDFEEAEEHFSYNISGAYMGEHTPVFMAGVRVSTNSKNIRMIEQAMNL